MDKYTKLDASGKPLSPAAFSILDASTGLTWTAADIGADRMTFAEAEKAIATLKSSVHGGFTDWRLPTIKELLTLVDYERSDPAGDPALGMQSSWYWSSSPDASGPADYAWVVNFHYGHSGCYVRYGGARVRAVRSVSPASASQ